MEIFHQSFQYTPSNLSNFIEFHFTSTICATIFTAEYLKLKLLIRLYVLCCVEF